jgi:membrane protein DedA with SNARE-associated domain
MGITAFIAECATQFIDATGYTSVLVLMAMESMVFPVPSEAVMPFAGFLVVTGRFSFAGVIIASTIGSIIGSSLSYSMGRYGGTPFVDRFGKYFFLHQDHLAFTERFFTKYGEATIFVCRFIPVVRHLISIPAGAGRMNLLKFSMYTIAGAGIWNTFLTVCGYYQKQNWEEVMRYSHIVDIVVVLILLAGVAYFALRHLGATRIR